MHKVRIFIENFKKRRILDDSGMSLIDTILAVALTLILIGGTTTALSSAMAANDASLAKAHKTVITNGLESQIRNASINALAIQQSSDGSQLNVKTKEGKCLGWRFNSGKVQTFNKTTAISQTFGWSTLSDNVSNLTFTSTPVQLGYNLTMLDSENYKKSFPLSVASGQSAPCW